MEGNNRCVSVLVPMYNESNTIEKVIQGLSALPFVTEIIVIDDGSKDNSCDIVKKYVSDRIHLVCLEKNSGKTNAISVGLSRVKGDIVIIQDADLEYDPEEMEAVIEPICKGRADVVYGSRFMVRKAGRVLYYYHYIANKFLTSLSNLLTNLNMTDIETGYKAFRTPILKKMKLTSSGFGMEIEITAKISKLPLRIYEVPISYYGRTYAEGKKIGLMDGVAAVGYIFYFNLIAPFTTECKKYFSEIRSDFNLS